MSAYWWSPDNPWHRDAALQLCRAFGWGTVERIDSNILRLRAESA